MKKNTIAGILLAAAAIIVLAVLAVYLTVQHRDALFPAGNTPAESEAEAVLIALHESETEAPLHSGADGDASADDSSDLPELFVIWVGDSRTIGMRDAVKNDDIYIGASGEGYDWLSEVGLPQVEDAIETYPDAPVVFNFGVNDYDNMENYLALYESLLEEYPDTHFYFLAVNPIDPVVCKNITNEEIADFNSHLRDSFGDDAYIDSYTYLLMNEAVTVDGIHYSKEDYQAVYEFAVKSIVKKESLR